VAVCISWFLIRLFPLVLDSTDPDALAQPHFYFDRRVFGFTVGLMAATVFLFGVVPSIWYSSMKLLPGLRQMKGGHSKAAGISLKTLMVLEVAFAVVTVISTSLLTRSLLGTAHVDLGFNNRSVLIATLDQPYDKHSGAITYYADLVARLRSDIGRGDVSVASRPPLASYGGGRSTPVRIVKQEADAASDVGCGYAVVGPRYFGVIEAALLTGREFAEADSDTNVPVAVVNEAMARRLFNSVNVVGRAFFVSPELRERRVVIGVVRDQKIDRVVGEATKPYFYIPYAQSSDTDMVVLVSARVTPAAAMAKIQGAVKAAGQGVELRSITSMEELIHARLQEMYMLVACVGLMSALGIAVAALGLYGLTSYLVNLGNRDNAIRIALGASPAGVITRIQRGTMTIAVVGLLVGIPAALLATQAFSSSLYGVSARDPVSYLAGCVLVLGVIQFAGLVPAMRAGKVDPIALLKQE
jgi:predicted permease